MDSVRTRTSANIVKSQQAMVNGLGASSVFHCERIFLVTTRLPLFSVGHKFWCITLGEQGYAEKNPTPRLAYSFL